MASRLLPEVFAGYEEDDRITVLDLGPGNADTLRFLSRFRARVFFADLLDNPNIAHPPEDTDHAALVDLITRQLSVPPGTTIDVCLMWDYLHFVDLNTIEALSRALTPLLSQQTRGYAFGALHGKQPGDNNDYGICDIDHLAAHPRDHEPRYLAHSQQRIADHFPTLRISRGTLLREGRLELLFEGV